MEWASSWKCGICGHGNEASQKVCESCPSSSPKKSRKPANAIVIDSDSDSDGEDGGGAVAWEIMLGSKWSPYDAESSAILESVHSVNKPSCILRLHGQKYLIDLRKKTQTNMKTKFSRKVRRRTSGGSKSKSKSSSKSRTKSSSSSSSASKSSKKKAPAPSASSKKKAPASSASSSASSKKKAPASSAKKRKKTSVSSKVEFTPHKKVAKRSDAGLSASKKRSASLVEPPKAPPENVNLDITDILNELAKNEFNSGVMYKGQAYKKAANTLKMLDYRITSGKDAKKLPGIGQKIGDKIQEILDTGGLEKLEKAKDDDHLTAINELCRVYGIGPKVAKKFYEEHDITSLAQLAARQDLLSHSQKVGLKYVRDFEQRIPREEIKEIEVAVKAVADEVDAELELLVCGSYRRGAKSCGDIDFLVTHPNYTSKNFKKAGHVLPALVKGLKTTGLLTDHLAEGTTKYMGVCKLPEIGESGKTKKDSKKEKKKEAAKSAFKFVIPSFADDDEDDDDDMGVPELFRAKSSSISELLAMKDDEEKSANNKAASSAKSSDDSSIKSSDSSASPAKKDDVEKRFARRIDIRFVPRDAFPFAVLYFTGSDTFNRSMRQHAVENGYTMNETGIHKILKSEKVSGKPLQIKAKGDAIPCDTEKEIFELIKWKWIGPNERNW